MRSHSHPPANRSPANSTPSSTVKLPASSITPPTPCPPRNPSSLPPNPQTPPPLRIRLPPPSPPQMDYAHLLQRPRRNLPALNGRSPSPSRSPPRPPSLHRPALPHPRRHHHS